MTTTRDESITFPRAATFRTLGGGPGNGRDVFACSRCGALVLNSENSRDRHTGWHAENAAEPVDALDDRTKLDFTRGENKRLEGVARAAAFLLQQEGHVLLADGVSQVIDNIIATRLTEGSR